MKLQYITLILGLGIILGSANPANAFSLKPTLVGYQTEFFPPSAPGLPSQPSKITPITGTEIVITDNQIKNTLGIFSKKLKGCSVFLQTH